MTLRARKPPLARLSMTYDGKSYTIFRWNNYRACPGFRPVTIRAYTRGHDRAKGDIQLSKTGRNSTARRPLKGAACLMLALRDNLASPLACQGTSLENRPIPESEPSPRARADRSTAFQARDPCAVQYTGRPDFWTTRPHAAFAARSTRRALSWTRPLRQAGGNPFDYRSRFALVTALPAENHAFGAPRPDGRGT